MSTGRGSGSGAGVHPIPAGSRKIVQSLKEIVNCSEAEIYATLKDCNMDPNEAVNRLISQDPFHEVKSKREKKKEGKDTESRPHSAQNNSNRSSKNVVDRYPGRSSSTPYSSSEYPLSHGKLAVKKENGSTTHAGSLCAVPVVAGNNRSLGPSGLRDGFNAENKVSPWGTSDSETFGTQPPSGYQSAWQGAGGQVSMADIVRMGRLHDKASNPSSSSHYNASHPNIQGSTALLHNFSEDLSTVHETGVSLALGGHSHDELHSIEMPAEAKMLSFQDYSVDSDLHPVPSDLLLNSIDQQFKPEEIIEELDNNTENTGTNDVVSVFISSRKVPEDNSRSAFLSETENDFHENMASYQPQGHDFNHHEDEEDGASIATVTRNLLEIDIKEDDNGLQSDADTVSVIIPEHLLVQTVDCSHLSFGSFGSGIGDGYTPGARTPLPLETNLEETHNKVDVTSVGYLESRNTDYFVGDSVRNASDGDLYHRTNASPGSYDTPSASQPEKLKPENVEVAHGNHFFPALNPDYPYDDVQHLKSAFSQPQTSSQIQNIAPAPFTNVMSHTNSLPSTLLACNIPPSREPDIQYSPFATSQSVSSAKYGSSVSSIGSSAISISEALKIAGFSSMPSAPQGLSGTNVATGPPIPQHLAVHSYSQPTLPLGPYANMIGYPFLPQSYPFMSSAFQQTLTSNGTYQPSLAGILPQYKNNISVGSLGQSSTMASGYATFGNTTTIPGNFLLNHPTALSGATVNYDDTMISPYKESNHLLSLQQNGNSGLWLDGLSSRTMSAVPNATLHNYQGQNQQPVGFRHGQQPSQDYGNPGYANFYHSQVGGASMDQQPQNPRDGSLGSSQGQPKQPQIWQNGY